MSKTAGMDAQKITKLHKKGKAPAMEAGRGVESAALIIWGSIIRHKIKVDCMIDLLLLA